MRGKWGHETERGRFTGLILPKSHSQLIYWQSVRARRRISTEAPNAGNGIALKRTALRREDVCLFDQAGTRQMTSQLAAEIEVAGPVKSAKLIDRHPHAEEQR